MNNFRVFVGFTLLVATANLLLHLDYPKWIGNEALLQVWIGNIQDFRSPLAATLSLLTYHSFDSFGWPPFAFRIFSVLLLSGALTGVYVWLRPVNGPKTMRVFPLVVLSAPLVIVYGKVATPDVWQLALHAMLFALLIRYLKQAQRRWAIGLWMVFVLAIWVNPFMTALFVGALWLLLWRLHPQGSRINALYLPGGVLLALLAAFVGGVTPFALQEFQFFGRIAYWQFPLFVLIGVLPWIGFAASGIWELLQKLRKREELATIFAAGLLAGLLSMSPAVLVVLSLIIARQAAVYDLKNYPYRNVVLTVALLHLVAAFCGVVYLLTFAFQDLGTVGFRSAIAVGTGYWMPSLIAAIGLLGVQRRFYIGGMATAGLLVLLLALVQLFPLIMYG